MAAGIFTPFLQKRMLIICHSFLFIFQSVTNVWCCAGFIQNCLHHATAPIQIKHCTSRSPIYPFFQQDLFLGICSNISRRPSVLLPDLQSACRANRSIKTEVLKALHDIMRAVDLSELTLLDLSTSCFSQI